MSQSSSLARVQARGQAQGLSRSRLFDHCQATVAAPLLDSIVVNDDSRVRKWDESECAPSASDFPEADEMP